MDPVFDILSNAVFHQHLHEVPRQSVSAIKQIGNEPEGVNLSLFPLQILDDWAGEVLLDLFREVYNLEADDVDEDGADGAVQLVGLLGFLFEVGIDFHQQPIEPLEIFLQGPRYLLVLTVLLDLLHLAVEIGESRSAKKFIDTLDNFLNIAELSMKALLDSKIRQFLVPQPPPNRHLILLDLLRVLHSVYQSNNNPTPTKRSHETNLLLP